MSCGGGVAVAARTALMSEPPSPAAAASSAADVERDSLLATKTHVPVVQQDLVRHPRLADRLDEGLEPGLVLVCHPAGVRQDGPDGRVGSQR